MKNIPPELIHLIIDEFFRIDSVKGLVSLATVNKRINAIVYSTKAYIIFEVFEKHFILTNGGRTIEHLLTSDRLFRRYDDREHDPYISISDELRSKWNKYDFLNIAKYYYKVGRKIDSADFVAACNGYFDLVKWIHTISDLPPYFYGLTLYIKNPIEFGILNAYLNGCFDIAEWLVVTLNVIPDIVNMLLEMFHMDYTDIEDIIFRTKYYQFYLQFCQRHEDFVSPEDAPPQDQ